MRKATLVLVLCATFSSTAAAAATGPTFYLALTPRECAIGPIVQKKLTVVPCSDARHNLEVYAIGHGGWGHAPTSHSPALAAARQICLAAFTRITGRPLATTQGWFATWPDPGAEQAKFADKVTCMFRDYPGLRPLGSGWHVR
jgi:hypothetical protein